MISIHYSNYKSFLNLHLESILDYCDDKKWKFNEKKLSSNVKKYFGNFLSNFEELLECSPETLREIKDYYNSLNAQDQRVIKKDLNLKSLYAYFNKSKSPFNSKKRNVSIYNANYLANKIDVFTCPYCNENYTYSFRYDHKNGELGRTFDFDHIYSQDVYPFFAISFFNLVPSCKTCNQIKLNKDEDFFNPHLPVNVDDLFFYDLAPVDAGFINDSSKIKLNLIIKKGSYFSELKKSISIVEQLNRYRMHQDLIVDVLNKKRMYHDGYVSALKRQLPILSNASEYDLKKNLYGVYFDHKEYYKRSFSKLTNDIIKSKVI